MRMVHWIFPLLAVGLLAFSACKRNQAAPQASGGHFGLDVDVAKLDTEFATVTPDLQQHIAVLKHAFRYSQLPQAATELEALANSPDLTSDQKKLVEDLIDQTRQAITNAPAPQGQ
jgi:hypothetical protein